MRGVNCCIKIDGAGRYLTRSSDLTEHTIGQQLPLRLTSLLGQNGTVDDVLAIGSNSHVIKLTVEVTSGNSRDHIAGGDCSRQVIPVRFAEVDDGRTS